MPVPGQVGQQLEGEEGLCVGLRVHRHVTAQGAWCWGEGGETRAQGTCSGEVVLGGETRSGDAVLGG